MEKVQEEITTKYYDWEKLLSYNADISMIVSHRGLGKTYGLRKRCIQDFLKNGYRYVEIYRTEAELDRVCYSEFSKIEANNEFPGYMFKVQKAQGYIAKIPENEKEKPKWKLLCYFVSMSCAQQAKKMTFAKVKRIVLDEFIIDREIDKKTQYLRNEYFSLANLVDTLSRERSDDNSTKPHVYLCANACSLMNPYFEFYGIDKVPQPGFHWFRNKTVLLHMVANEEYPGYGAEKIENTVAGRMIKNTKVESVSAHNEFKEDTSGLIEKKPSRAKYEAGFICDGNKIGVWSDIKEGYFYINDKVLEDDYIVPFYITREDQTVNRMAARKATPAIQALTDAHYSGILRYSSITVYNNFMDMMKKFGV